MLNGYVSATALSSANNHFITGTAGKTRTYRTYLRSIEHGGLTLAVWCSNSVDSTWDDGSISRANLPGGRWRIDSAFFADGGRAPDGSVIPGTEAALTFGGKRAKDVSPGETFASDDVHVQLPEGHYLAFTWSITHLSDDGGIPFNIETPLASVFEAEGDAAGQASNDGYRRAGNVLVLPDFIGLAQEEGKRFVFLGDSITQGVRTAMDGYTYWAARISAALPEAYGAWNIGSGWARAYDAASDGAWLAKAKQADEIVIALGVNDIGTAGRSGDQVERDLHTIIAKLRAANPAMRILLCTVPTFNFTGEQERHWRQVNAAIRGGVFAADRVFDIAAVLSREAPDDHLLQPGYMTNEFDPHPNGAAGKAVAEAFLAWYSRSEA